MEQKLFGRKVLLENINNKNIINVDLGRQNRDLIPQLKKNNISFQLKDDSFFKKYAQNLNHQGVIITMKNNTIKDLSSLLSAIKTKSTSVILVIDSIQDPQNFGSILRTCEAMQVDAVIYKKDNQVQINEFVIKTSMGAIQNLNLIKVINLSQAIQQLKKIGYWIYASTLSSKSAIYTEIKYDKKVVLIVGNEENGVSQLLTKEADFQTMIPMHGQIQSLNVSVATGILLAQIKYQLEKYEKNK